MPTTRLVRDFSSQTATNDKKCTISFWFKFTETLTGGSDRWLFGEYTGSQDHAYIYLRNDKSIGVYGRASGSSTFSLITNKKFYDQSGWYHCVVACDTTQATAADRIKLYINGEQITSWATESHPSQDLVLRWNNDGAYHYIGGVNGVLTHYDGLMSHFHLCDGQQLAPTVFGETDSTTGEWSIITAPSFTPGTCGFSILKDGNSVTDVSANSNNWTVQAGSLTNTKDCPDNVFATVNPLVRHQTTNTNGNLRVANGTTNWYGIPATLGASLGKYYWEYKLTVGNSWSQCGVMSSKPNGGYDGIYSTYVGANSGGLALNSGQGDFYNDGSNGAYGTSAWFSGGLAEGDIIGVALDATNSKIWFAKNGTWGNSSNPSTDSGAIDFSGDTDFTNHKPYLPAFSVHNCTVDINFGNGYFGTTAVATNSGNGYQDADGNGIFNYTVPTNYRALCTKGLNQ